jgi:hypothetical protein
MVNYQVCIETFDTPVRPGEEFRNHDIRFEYRIGYRAALAFAKAEAAKGKLGRVVSISKPRGGFRKVA